MNGETNKKIIIALIFTMLLTVTLSVIFSMAISIKFLDHQKDFYDSELRSFESKIFERIESLEDSIPDDEELNDLKNKFSDLRRDIRDDINDLSEEIDDNYNRLRDRLDKLWVYITSRGY